MIRRRKDLLLAASKKNTRDLSQSNISLNYKTGDIFKLRMGVLVAQSCPTLCGPMDCNPPGSSVHGILQSRILEWVAIPFSRGSSQPRDQTRVSCIAGRFFEPPRKPGYTYTYMCISIHRYGMTELKCMFMFNLISYC